MKKLIQSMEKLGRNGSINQFNSLEEMLSTHNIEADVMELEKNLSRDLICSMDPGDDDDD